MKNTPIYYKKNINGEEYCIFHAPNSIKEKFTHEEKQLYKKIIIEYIDKSIEVGSDIDFSYVVFYEKFYFKELNSSIFDFNFETINKRYIETDVKICFTKAVFYDYFRLDNIICKELSFKDTEFHKGGAIKNYGREDNVYIEKLIFRPFIVQSDFVIDIGQYANKDGIIETETTGTIKEIEFENHKEGNGIIYFIGINEKTEKADFRNKILDNLSFQNCDLSNAFFLNAKVDKTEFRNCGFPQGYIYDSYDVFNGKSGITFIIFIVATGGSLFLIKFNKYGERYLNEFSYIITEYSFFIILFSPFLLLALFFHIANFIKFIESKIANLNIENSVHGEHTLNPLKSIGRHFSIADEIDLYNKYYKNKNISHKKEILSSFTALAASYIQLKNNFSRYDYQMEGSFFYAQRYFEVLTSRNKDQMIERWM
ncbi:MAG: pentapeptide repeat-containing protein, partial [Bacteroidales bacterium]|nr:pentapeptide repeat-containing protein [Bacteroidales bacterium]